MVGLYRGRVERHMLSTVNEVISAGVLGLVHGVVGLVCY